MYFIMNMKERIHIMEQEIGCYSNEV